MRHPTLVDIADRLRVSPSTVSRALNDHPDIREDTKEAVRKLAKELRYSPNPIAQSLKNSRTTTIGVVVPEIKHDFFSSAISGIEEVAYHAGYTILLCQSNESSEREALNINALVNHRVAGIIVSIAQETTSGKHFQDVLRRKVPLVFFDRACEGVAASKVVIDDYASAFGAVTHLIQRGYKRIVHLAGPQDLVICQRRCKGYLDALKQANPPVESERVLCRGLHEQDGYASMDALLKEHTIPDAIFAVNDPVAVGAFQRIREAGLSIPGDVAIMGFSNNKITSLLDPPMTTVDQPSFEMGKRAAEILIESIEGNAHEPRTLVLETHLIVRGST